jgi:hypothetical protein
MLFFFAFFPFFSDLSMSAFFKVYSGFYFNAVAPGDGFPRGSLDFIELVEIPPFFEVCFPSDSSCFDYPFISAN